MRFPVAISGTSGLVSAASRGAPRSLAPRSPGHRFGLLASLACIAGCSALPAFLPQESLSSGFELSGRVALKYGDEAASAKVQWRHSIGADDMLITNALGQGIARITRLRGEVTLETADSRQFQAANAESLSEQVLGWRLPLSGLPDWLRARASPGEAAQTRAGADGRLLELAQDAWRIEYQEYRDERPVRLRLTRPNLEIRLIIDSWQEVEP
jgi:outer membrane lipoprotein LolB